ncbi:hypothetical protein BJY00DRAFT_272157 [Aspergillus carlsbadensis]|nr:hypothetical protein BJY00DRAFT_272157 [Aspergillus carlsbadensis]
MKHAQRPRRLSWNLATLVLIIAWLPCHCLGAAVRRGVSYDFGTSIRNNFTSNQTTTSLAATASSRVSSGDFPVCTDLQGPFVPFCLPEDGADVLVDTTYYVTWNADFYPLNATITIELRYSDSLEGSSAFTSEKTDNSYGYIPLHMRRDWLQGKPNNTLTLYIIELDSTLDRRASARQGPTITLRPKPVKHYKPSPPARFNKQAVYIGVPVSIAVVSIVVIALVCSMRRTREAIANIFPNPRRRGYGIGRSRTQRLRGDGRESSDFNESVSSKRYPTDLETGLLDGTGSERYNYDHERGASYPFRRDVSRLKSWVG